MHDRAARFIERRQRTIEVFTRVGWLAKGAVYLLFGVTAVAIARQSAPSDEASPQGALGEVMAAPAGRPMLGLVAVGLLLYAIWIGGIVGSIGRGVVTALVGFFLVGFFVVQSAVHFDSEDARGFDQALREATTTMAGTAFVWVSAVGLIACGTFCVLSHRRPTLGDTS